MQPSSQPAQAVAPYENRKSATSKKLENFLVMMIAAGGNVSLACRRAKLSTSVLYHHRITNPEFNARYLEAKERSVEVLEDEVVRRGFQGVDKPVFHKGKRVDTVKDYSDLLLIFMLKAARPDKYRERYDVTGNINVNGIDATLMTEGELAAIAAGKLTKEMVDAIRARQLEKQSAAQSTAPALPSSVSDAAQEPVDV